MMMNYKNWELDHTGGGNYSFIKDFTTKNKKNAMVMVNELGASVPLHENNTYKTKKEYVEDYTYDYIECIDWIDEKTGYVVNENALSLFSSNQIEDIIDACKQLDKLYEEGF